MGMSVIEEMPLGRKEKGDREMYQCVLRTWAESL